MRGSNYLNQLLDGAEVVWLPLEHVTLYEQPTKYLVRTKNYDNTYATPVLTAGKTFILGYTKETAGVYHASKNPVIIFDDFTTANKWVDFNFKAKSSAMKLVSSRDDSRFLLKYVYYWMNTLPSGFVAGDHKRQWISNFCKKKIPIPCPDDREKSLAIQAEIVRILDAFTALTAELTAELTARRKQYNYYVKQILTFDEADVEWKPLGELAIIGTGSRNTNESTDDGEYPFFVRSQRPRRINSWEFDETAIVTAGDGNVGKVWHYVTGKYGLHFRAYRIVVEDLGLNPKFLFYFLKSNPHKFKLLTSVHGTVTSVKKHKLEKYPVPIPYSNDPKKSLAEQARVVDILDKFDTLTTSVSKGLPREIELRQKQYKYYRDLLLNFPRPEEKQTK